MQSSPDSLSLIEIVLFFAPLLVLLGLLAVVVRDMRRSLQAASFIRRGRYAEARVVNDRIAKSWMGLFPFVRHASRYNVALTFHLEGAFERSLAMLADRNPASLDKNLRYATASLEASNLVLLGKDSARAATLLEDAGKIHQVPEDLVFLAHAKLDLGDAASAEALLERAGTSRQGAVRLGVNVLIEDQAHHAAIFHTARGLLLIKLGRVDEAAGEFRRAAAIPLQNWYTERARALLPPAGGDVDPRSSLAPQIVDE